ncbi:Tigger transposable element-derived protein 4 [Araneus ventricosus]|uniref:Tigger transposable element-derived protein 4 n=1 Tax=Araneus ventricosus TaxID=182803 RepID=A0A4Y2DHD1_ARAVE|nr:Tigger transposable element-derived protein 4 [Araneus ventricosus]
MAKVISGESKDIDGDDSENWITETLSKILKDFEPENILNADETASFFQCLPQKTLTFKKEKCFGGKQSKARLTVMLGSNMTGHQKLKPLVIGRSKNPRCFKGAKSLEVDYDFNKQSWMTSEICEKWFQKLDKHRTIRNSFAKAGFFVSSENSASTEDEDDIPSEEVEKMWIQLREKEEINDEVLIDDFLSLDSEAETSETLTELDILDSVKNKNNTTMNYDEDGNDHMMQKSTNLRMMKC